MSETHDLVVIGGGPAGLAAAVQGRALGLDVMLIDEQPAPGGQIYRGVERAQSEGRAAALGEDYLRGLALARDFRSSGARYLPGHQVWQVERDGRVFVSDGETSRLITGKRVLVAVGSMERPVPIPGWTLPGVMTVGAAQILHKTLDLLPGEGVWIAGSGPLALYFAAEVAAAGGRIAGFLDTSRRANRKAARRHWRGALAGWKYLVKGNRFLSRIRSAGFRYVKEVEAVEALGSERIERVRWQVAGKWHEAPATGLLLHEGVVPNAQMTMAIGCAHEWDPVQHCFRPVVSEFGRTDLPAILVAGDCGGIGGARVAESRGRMAAIGAAGDLGKVEAPKRYDLAMRERAIMAPHERVRPFLDALFPPRAAILAPADDVVACRCEVVTAGRIREAVKLGCLGPNQVKSFTRCGMGPCQGRLCGLTVTETIAAARKVSPKEVGAYRVRSPLKPLRLAELAALADEPEAR